MWCLWTKFVFRAKCGGGEAGDKKNDKHIEKLVDSVRGWRLEKIESCFGIPTRQAGAATSSHGTMPGGLSSVEFPSGERVFFGSITWKLDP